MVYVFCTGKDDVTGNLTLTLVAVHTPYLPFDENKELVFNYNVNFSKDPIFQGQHSLSVLNLLYIP